MSARLHRSQNAAAWGADIDARAERQRAAEQAAAILAQYLTVGGATVDITEDASGDEPATITTCLGCGTGNSARWDLAYYTAPIGPGYPERTATARSDARRQAEREARTWAQDHASTCRAMPTPGGAR